MSEPNRRREIDRTCDLVEQLIADVKCLHDSFERFNKKYSLPLDDMIASKKYWNGVKDDVIKKSAAAAMWSIIAAIGVAMVYYVQTHLGIDVSAKK